MFANFRFFSVTVLAVLSCCALPATEAVNINYNNVCLLTANNELISSGDSCTNYYSCQNGVATLKTCQPGTYFDKNAQQCSASANCASSSGNPCEQKAVGSFASVAGSCQGYYYCGASGPVLGSCPIGTNFNGQSQTCLYASEYPCVNTGLNGGTGDGGGSSEVGINLCSFMPDGIFFGSAAACGIWNLCTNGVMTTGSCPTNYLFNPTIQACDYPTNFNCAQVTHDPNLVNSPSVGGPCTTAGATSASAQCNTYYVCDGTNNVLNTCQSGYYYDTINATCVLRMNARNNCDRCQGTTLTFVNAYSTVDCTGYLYCQNGVEAGSGTCASGFFDEKSGACVVGGEEPQYLCCNPPESTGESTTDSSSGTTVSDSSDSTDGSTSSDATTAGTGEETTEATTDPTTTTTVAAA